MLNATVKATGVLRDENILVASHRAVFEGGRLGADALAEAYEKHFQAAMLVPPIKTQPFERFSLVDPTVRMTVRSGTAPD